jgi:long-chain acyl-CoA synthetase
MSMQATVPVRWGTHIEVQEVSGHPCRVYAQRPRALAELLVDAQRWSPRPFLVQGDRRLSVAQHAQAVARVAAELQKHGVGRGDSVLLQGFNHIEWLVTFWAIQCVGATAALGNAWWSSPETTAAIELVQPRLVIVDKPPEAPLPAGVALLRFSDLRAVVDRQEETALEIAEVDEEAAALVIFSSGTTGQAKGVVMSHRSVIANVHSLLHMTGRLPSKLDASHPGTVNLVTMPLFHQGGMQIALMTMLTGGKVVFLKGRFDPLEVLQLMQTEKVRAWGSVPTMVSRVIQHEAFAAYDTSSVSSVQMGGAAVPQELREQVARCFPNSRKRVGSMYGLTETGVVAAGAGSDVEGRPGCVGRPLPSAEVRIASPNAEGVGEVQARAASATSGYLGDTTPIANADGWIASGDLGRFDGEGRLYIVGRSKDMIIRAGENIASAHVEGCLRTHPCVIEVAVVPLPNPDLGEEVGAAVVLRPGEQVSIEELRAHAAGQLAKFEVPSRWWLRYDPLPTNATGKVLKRDVLAQWPQSV